MGASQQRPDGIIDGINLTPLVDVTLVLLVVFMVTAKILVAPAVPLDLPTASAPSAVQTILSVSMPSDGSVVLDGRTLSDAQLTARARAALAADAELRAVIQADGDVTHRRVIAVIDALKLGGVTRIAFGAVPAPSPAGADRGR